MYLSLTFYNGAETANKVERKTKTTGVHGTKICSCHLLSKMEQRQMICGSVVEREIKTTGVHGNIICGCHLQATMEQRQTMVVQWRER